jgi:hypothetical protein
MSWSWHFAGLDKKVSTLDLVVVLKQSALRRPRGPRTVLVVSTPVARTHEEVRLSKPANRAAQMRAINSEYLEGLAVNVPNPAWNVGGFSVPRTDHGISVGGEPSLAGGKLLQPSER